MQKGDADNTNPRRRPNDGINALVDQLERIETTLSSVLAEAKKTNGRVTDLERGFKTVTDDLYGADEPRRREHAPGMMAKLDETRRLTFDLSTARDESEAVRDFKKWMVGIGLTVIATMVAAIGVMATLVGSL